MLFCPSSISEVVIKKVDDLHETSSVLLLIQSFFMHYLNTTGTTKVKNLETNIASLAVKLTDEDVREISDAVPACEVAGEREVDVFTKFSWRFATTPPK